VLGAEVVLAAAAATALAAMDSVVEAVVQQCVVSAGDVWQLRYAVRVLERMAEHGNGLLFTGWCPPLLLTLS
jgi:hypothetical protein